MNERPVYPMQDRQYAAVLRGAVLLLAGLFLLNCLSPLRIHYDMLRYFAIKDCIEQGCPPTADPRDYFPYGYTALLLTLSRLGILSSFSIIFINCLYLLGGLYFVRKTFAHLRSPYFFFLLVLLNWTIIKFVTHPLSELQYLFFSLASLYAFYRFSRDKKILWLLLAFALTALAILTRTVGIALLAALCTGLIQEYRHRLLRLARKNRLISAGLLGCLLIVVLFSRQLGLDHYTEVFSRQFKAGASLAGVLAGHLSEWGEISINTSGVKAIRYLPVPLGKWIFLLAGLAALSGFVYLCFIRKNRIPFIVKAYLFFYLLLMFNWPFADPRFWVPVIPLIAAVIAQTPFRKRFGLKIPLSACLLVYIVFGIASVGYMTYTSLNKKVFARTQAAGVYRNEYETHFFGRPLSDTARHTDPYVMSVLERYDK
jgi:hypothetical protein